MPTYYVDHGGSATDPYETQAKAVTSIEALLAAKALAGGDIIYLCDNAGTGEVITSVIDQNAGGTRTGGYIKFIGCNSSGVVDGTRYVIDGNNNNIHMWDLAGYDHIWFENIELKNNGTGNYDGWYSSANYSHAHVWINCCAADIARHGWVANYIFYSQFWRCVSYANGGSGYVSYGQNRFLFCCARDNTASGFLCRSIDTLYNCVSHSNTDDGVAISVPGVLILNSVIDSNDDDGVLGVDSTGGYLDVLVGCRITNHSQSSGDIAVVCAGDPLLTAFCYFEDNDGTYDIRDGATDAVAALHYNIPLEGGSTASNTYNTPDTNAGYVNETESTGGTTNLSTNYVSGTDPSLRRTAITIPYD